MVQYGECVLFSQLPDIHRALLEGLSFENTNAFCHCRHVSNNVKTNAFQFKWKNCFITL